MGIPVLPSKKELKDVAKERGFRGFQNLKKVELSQLLERFIPQQKRPIPTPRRNKITAPIPAPRTKKITAPRPIPAPRNILNIQNPEINVPILQPKIATAEEKQSSSFIEETVETVSSWMDWLAKSGEKYIIKPITSSLKNLKEKINVLFEKEKEFKVREGSSALNNFVREKIIEGKPGYDPQRFFEAVKNIVLTILKENKTIKVKMILDCTMKKTDLKTGKIIEVDSVFHSEIEINLEGTDEEKLFEKMVGRIGEVLANFQRNGSNWIFEKVNQLEIHMANWEPINASSYIPLPLKIQTKKAVINMKNEDNECFKWCVVRALNPVEKNSERITKELKDQSERLNWSGLRFPVDLKQIKLFEKNYSDIAINVFGFEKDVYPLRIQKTKKRININLLLIADEEKQHYCLVKNLSRLISNNFTKHCGSVEICRSCMNHFPDKKKLKVHEEYCFKNETVKIEMPDEESFISFKHHNRSIKVPFVFYADFEAFTEKVVSACEPNDQFSFTEQYQKHQPSGFSYKCVGFKTKKSVLYRAKDKNEDIAHKFVEMLEKDIKKIHKKFDFAKKMEPLTEKEKYEFEKAKICWICRQKFGEGEKKVRDHCHFTGKYRGAAHNICNLQFKKTKFTPVIFHNLSGYDAHLFVKNLGQSEGNIECIPNNEEKYISFSKDIVVDEYINKKGKKWK